MNLVEHALCVLIGTYNFTTREKYRELGVPVAYLWIDEDGNPGTSRVPDSAG